MDLLKDTNKNYIIFYHIRPDGDCIGSAYALAAYLQSIGNRVIVMGHDPVPEQFKYQTMELFNGFSDKVMMEDIIKISVDTATPERLGRFSEKKIDICIDHHINNTISAPIKIVDEEAASCTELIFELLKDHLAQNPMRVKICDLLFMGIITDTNCFRNESVRPNTFRAAAALAEMGADFLGIAQRHALIKSAAQIEMEKRLTASYETIEEYGIVSGVLTQNDAKEIGVGINSFESISALPMIMQETRISLVVRELGEGTSRVAVRTRGEFNAEAIAGIYGGGGHYNAAGCTLRVSPDEMRKLFVEAAVKYIEEYDTAASTSEC